MAVAVMQGANRHIRSSMGFSILPKDTSTHGPGGLTPPLSHSHMIYQITCSFFEPIKDFMLLFTIAVELPLGPFKHT